MVMRHNKEIPMLRTPLCTAAILLAGLPVATGAFAAEVQIQTANPVIELTVYEEVEATPDMVTISAGVTTDAPTAVAALRQNSVEMRRVIDRLTSLGVDENNIQTTGLNLNAQYEYDRDNQRQIFRGYRASNRVSVEFDDIEGVGEILDALVQAGATDLNGPSFSVEDDTQAKAAARRNAMERAERQASEYARMAGYSGVRLLQVQETITGRGPQPVDSNAIVVTGTRMARDEAAPIRPGTIGTGVNVSVTYEMTR